MDARRAGPPAVLPKRLLFDKRYGWIYDEWKDPSEEALTGGRGMFCVLPIAKALITAASHSVRIQIYFAAASVTKAFQNPGEFSPPALLANLNGQCQKLMQRTNLKLLTFQRNSSAQNTHMV